MVLSKVLLLLLVLQERAARQKVTKGVLKTPGARTKPLNQKKCLVVCLSVLILLLLLLV